MKQEHLKGMKTIAAALGRSVTDFQRKMTDGNPEAWPVTKVDGCYTMTEAGLKGWLQGQWERTNEPYPDLFIAAASNRTVDHRFLAQLASGMADLEDESERGRVIAAALPLLDRYEDFLERFEDTLHRWGIDLAALRAKRQDYLERMADRGAT